MKNEEFKSTKTSEATEESEENEDGEYGSHNKLASLNDENESLRDSEELSQTNTTSSASKPADENQERLEIEIENLSNEIDVKRKLINELETNNKNLDKMRSFYENKLNTLQSMFDWFNNRQSFFKRQFFLSNLFGKLFCNI